ncbi:hypothetical protein CLV92_106173 [Kineococcus xinjiangensis]|uniref:Uncharacterized protein n=1 Tax=Kineococcus xinjiangensis TaxID=512762 RepID=A0A2S6IM92_9ACTN|nr:hypothetical protein [Kineococcus xinjiangensis]PPK95352.1 hypothetical protein CLV92_106173 [Kineococcus xinjiangensis]
MRGGAVLAERTATRSTERAGAAALTPQARAALRAAKVVDVERRVGTRGETGVRVIVSNDGRIINAFPARIP